MPYGHCEKVKTYTLQGKELSQTKAERAVTEAQRGLLAALSKMRPKTIGVKEQCPRCGVFGCTKGCNRPTETQAIQYVSDISSWRKRLALAKLELEGMGVNQFGL